MGVYVRLGKRERIGLLPLYLRVPCGDSAEGAGPEDAVLQWGIPDRDPPRAYVLNPVKNMLRARHPRIVKDIWRLNGLKTEPVGGWIQQFRVAVFQQDVLGVWAGYRHPAWVAAAGSAAGAGGALRPGMTGASGRRSGPPVRSPGRGASAPVRPEEAGFRELPEEEQGAFHVRRAKRDAVRAVYALGLSTGLVRIGIDSRGGTVVLGADPAPELDDRMAELFADAINRYAEEREAADRAEREAANGPNDGSVRPASANRLLLGADPEFVLRRPDGRIASASRYLEKEGTVGCDAVVLSRDRIIHPLAELRPKPCPDPRGLVRELYRTMRQAAGLIGDDSLEWLSGSMPAKGLPIGGHVHVSGVWLNERLLRALDNYVALPLVLAEGKAAGQRRPRYGFLGDNRRKRHGGFEYRPLPSWLATPGLALGVLALVRAVALHYRELPARPLDSADVQCAYYRGDKAELLPAVRELWPHLERLAAYREYRAELDAFRDRLFRLEGWEEQADFRPAWKIPPFHGRVSTETPFVL